MAITFQQQAGRFAKKWAKSTACVLVLLGVQGCEEPPQHEVQTEVERPYDLLTRAIYSGKLQLDPHFARVTADAAPVRDLFEGLMQYDAKGNVVAGVARSHFSDDGKSWLFILDENARWSNGQAVIAGDFVASWQRLADPHSGSPFSGYLADIRLKNAAAIQRNEMSVDNLGVRALNDNTLLIELEQPNFQLPKMLLHSALLPTYQGKAPSEPFIGNGLYRLTAKEPQRLILQTKEPALAFKTVIYQLISTVQNPARFDLVENPLENYDQHRVLLPRRCSYYYEFNFNDPMVGQKAVRQAIKAMVSPSELSLNIGIPSHFVVPKTLWGEEERQLSTSSSEHHLEKLGIKASNPLKIGIRFTKNDLNQQLANRVVRSLSQSELFRVHFQSDEREWQHSPYQLRQVTKCGDYDDPFLFVKQFHSRYAQPESGYTNSEVDAALEQIESGELSEKERAQQIKKVVRLLEQDVAILPIFQYQRKITVNPGIVGIERQNGSEVIYSKDLSRQPKKDKE